MTDEPAGPVASARRSSGWTDPQVSGWWPAGRIRIGGNPSQQSSQNVCPGDNQLLFRGPHQDQILVDHVVAGAFGVHLKTAQNAPKRPGAVPDDQRFVAEGYRIEIVVAKEGLAQKEKGIHHEQLMEEPVVRTAFELREDRPTIPPEV